MKIRILLGAATLVVITGIAFCLTFGLRPKSVPIIKPSETASLFSAQRHLKIRFAPRLQKISIIKIGVDKENSFSAQAIELIKSIIPEEGAQRLVEMEPLEDLKNTIPKSNEAFFYVASLPESGSENCEDLFVCFTQKTAKAAQRKKFKSDLWVFALDQIGAQVYGMTGRAPSTL